MYSCICLDTEHIVMNTIYPFDSTLLWYV